MIKLHVQRDILSVLAIAFAALLLRTLELAHASIWIDEAFSAWMASQPLSVIHSVLKHFDFHPPLFYDALHFWMRLGSGEFILRLPSALFGAGNVILIYFLGKSLLSRKTAIAAALFWACLFYAIDEETWVRMYSAALFFSLFSSICLWKRWWIPYALSAILALDTHYFTAFILFAQWLWLMTQREYRAAIWIPMALALLWLPEASIFLAQMTRGTTALARPPLALGYLQWGGILSTFSLVRSMVWHLALSLAAIAAAIFTAVRLSKLNPAAARLLFLAAFIPWLLPFVISFVTPYHIYDYRYILLFAPFFLLLFFEGLAQLPKIAFIGVYGILIAMNLSAVWLNLTGSIQDQNWREAAARLSPMLAKGDIVFVEMQTSIFPLWYYLPNQFKIQWNGENFGPGRAGPIDWRIVKGADSIPEIARLSARHKREWLVLCQEQMIDSGEAVKTWLIRHARLTQALLIRSYDPTTEIKIFGFQS